MIGRWLVLAVLGLALAGCASGPRTKALDDIERRHIEDMQRTGGGGGGSM